ncbi:citrate synthase [Paenibacillus hemerocallicola]|uniref:Citrate synthase n=1 Tax=Paenibacillus hemerocallicola TaxID=1172614 RepID=A0A5C4T0Z3_9BACL|nr:citrate synthase [Paenibacillus hemerocallicola]TNJ61619.1 citrate synthase [Paenibacillus hemerocallicola]
MMAEQTEFRPGLEGIIASETDISYLDVAAEQIVIRGYDLIELARTVTYVDVVGLLLDGTLPDEAQQTKLAAELAAEAALPDAIWPIVAYPAPHKEAMDILRTGISALAAFDEELGDRSREANRRKALRLLAKVPNLVANGYRLQTGQAPIEPKRELSYGANFLYMLTGRLPDEREERAFDQSLIVYSEHEMPNSTFVARVIASTQSDLYGALTGAVASLKGTLHGGANEAVMYMLQEAKTPEGLEKLMKARLAGKERIMGFGHRVYMKKMDPRALLMKEALADLCERRGSRELYEMCELGERIMREEKGLYPNLDYYAAPVYYLLGIPIDLYTPIFLASRTAGIGAHVMEQHANNRLFRPRVLYNGPRGLRPTLQ